MKLLKYKIYCNTDSKYEYVWKESTDSAPTTCPANTSHSVNTSSVSVVLSQDSDVQKTQKAIAPDERTDRPVGFNKFTATKNSTTTHDFKITESGLYLMGGVLHTANQVLGDLISFVIIDIDNVLGFGANTVLSDYMKEYPVDPSGKTEFISESITESTIPQNTYCRLSYKSIGTTSDVEGVLGLKSFL